MLYTELKEMLEIDLWRREGTEFDKEEAGQLGNGMDLGGVRCMRDVGSLTRIEPPPLQ